MKLLLAKAWMCILAIIVVASVLCFLHMVYTTQPILLIIIAVFYGIISATFWSVKTIGAARNGKDS